MWCCGLSTRRLVYGLWMDVKDARFLVIDPDDEMNAKSSWTQGRDSI
jgi:hypothetical protein